MSFQRSGADCRSLVDLLSLRVQEDPVQRIYTFLAEGESEEDHLTRAELDRRARAVGATLQALAMRGERALLLYPPGLDFVTAFFGCLYAGAVAVPAYPPRWNRPQPQLRAVLRDAAPRVILTTAALLARLEAAAAQMPELRQPRWISTCDVSAAAAEEWLPPELQGNEPALLQYTSGSTGTPKGVVVRHDNLLHNEEMIRRAFRQSAASVIVGWLPLYHDMGLIGNVLQPLYAGARCILLSPMAFLQKPARWLQAISRYRATTSGGPNFAYELCVRKIGEEERRGLDLSSWQVAFNGAEPVRAETLERFARTFAAQGFRREAFYPCYGLAEATLFVTGSLGGAPPQGLGVRKDLLAQGHVVLPGVGEPPGRMLVSCGRPWMGQEVVIVDPEAGTPCAPDRVGEIWVRGDSLAAGYWNRTEESKATFGARLAESGEGPFLRTGDLGFLAGGDLFVTGRLKDLIILRGRNLYPQDLELTAERSHPDLRPGGGAAFGVDIEGEERLVVVHELERRQSGDLEAVATAVRAAVAEEHGAQVHEVVLIPPGTLPKTTSGKTQRRSCKDSYLTNQLPALGRSLLAGDIGDSPPELALDGEALRALAPGERRRALLAYLREQMARVARIAPASLDMELPALALGIDSLGAAELKGRLEGDLGIEVSLAELLEGASTAQLAGELLKGLESPADGRPAEAITPAPRHGSLPLSFAQRRLWFLDQLEPGSAAYNMPAALSLSGELDVPALAASLDWMRQRHEPLRTTFRTSGGEPVQVIAPAVPVPLPVADLGALAPALREALVASLVVEEARRPFDLSRGPLLRATLVRLCGREHLLLLTFHHIIADGWSLGILLRELPILYQAFVGGREPQLPALPVQYADYALWQHRSLTEQALETQLRYWMRQLADPPPGLELALAGPRPVARSSRAGTAAVVLPAELSEALAALGRREGVTLFMLLLAAFEVLLARYTQREQFLVGTPVANRRRAEVENLVGFFANTLALRAEVPLDASFRDLLTRVREITVAALVHQDVPFELLVEKLAPERGVSGNPLFQVMFVHQGATLELPLLPGLSLRRLPADSGMAKFDLTLSTAESGGDLRVLLEYRSDVCSPPAAARMLGHFAALLESVTADAGRRLAALPLLTEGERHQLVVDWNDTGGPAREGVSLYELFAAQARRTPGAAAVVYEAEQVTYCELESRAGRLAGWLRSVGVREDSLVGICLDRSPEMVIAILAVLRAGGAYLPLEPTQPRERMAAMLEEAKVAALLTRERFRSALPESEAALLCLDPGWESTAPAGAADAPLPSAESLAYVIFTSGSTGRPKGVMIPQRGICNRLLSAVAAYGLGERDHALQIFSFAFDASIPIFLQPLITGARVVLGRPGAEQDAGYLVHLIAEQEVAVAGLSPSLLRVFLQHPDVERCRSLRYVLSGIEAMTPEIQRRFYERLGARLAFGYGPTEASVSVTRWFCEPGAAARVVPVGRPITGTQIYLLDRCLEPVPSGLLGDLHIGGAGLARGYLAQPGPTAAAFIPDPFSGAPGCRLYRTGDLARQLPDGNIEFVGRADQQVKIRGFRVELGEVEAALARHPAVEDNVVVALDGTGGEKRLVAYLVARGQVPTAVELVRFLRGKLPEYMVPAAFVTMPALPLGASGKVDRTALPSPDTFPGPSTPFVAPRTPLERLLTGLWAERLKVERVGVNDDFFELGGHSLLAGEISAQLQEMLQTDVPLLPLFYQNPTVSGLAAGLLEGGLAADQLAALVES